MRTLPRLTALALLTLIATACGAAVDAVVGNGSVALTTLDAGTVESTGPIPFPSGAVLTASDGGARVRVACGGQLGSESTTEHTPGRGLVDFDLDDMARLRRRDDLAFDLEEGAAHVRTGVVSGRLIIMHSTCYVSVDGDAGPNADGVELRLAVKSGQLKVEVVRGNVVLNATDASQRNTTYVNLEAGETSVAMQGKSPELNATEWFEVE